MTDIDNCRRLTLMMRVADAARADIALTPERIYYRFATDETIEDGELPAAKRDFNELSKALITAASANEEDHDLSDDVKVSIFIDNRLAAIKLSENSLRRLVDELKVVAEEFAFLGGFC